VVAAKRTLAIHRRIQTVGGQAVGRRGRGPTDRLSDVLQVFAGFEANSSAWWDAYFLPGPWVPADAALARFHLEDAEAPKFNPFAALHRDPHRVENGIDRYLGFNLGYVGDLRYFVDDVDLDQCLGSPEFF
jgi:hypothetical protein